MTDNKLPALMFYPGDWMKDPAVRAASLEARGLWIDLLCLMHESPKRGYLAMKSGTAMNHQQIARVVGTDAKTCKKLIDELDDVGACSVTGDGVIFSRRMVRDQEKRIHKVEAGKRGGRMRVANEREARRATETGSDDARTAAKDKNVMQVWNSIPATKRKNKSTTVIAIQQAIHRCSQNGSGTPSKAAKMLCSKLNAYYKSHEGRGKFCRSASRFLDEDGFGEKPEAWTGIDQGF